MSAPFVLPTYGMPCCGHRITEHVDNPNQWGTSAPPACSCCRGAARLGAALLLMAEPPADDTRTSAQQRTVPTTPEQI